MYYDEDLLLDIRLNVLNRFVKKFVICEATYNHNGSEKKINFDITKFKKFEDKIIFLKLEKQPENLKRINETDVKRNSKILDNALLRENFQRNFLMNGIRDISDEDLILISDLDEIPNLNNYKYKNKISIFKHKMYCYKLNLTYPDFNWIGSKICKKKYLKSPQWLRNIKSKSYPIWRLDIFFSDKKYKNIEIIERGGWHFSNIKSANKIDHKMKNFLHHLEYEKSGLKINDISKLIKEKKVLYDYKVDKRESKWGGDIKLINSPISELPNYISENIDKFKDWID